MLNKLFFVFMGGGIGSGLRYIINVYTLQTNYPQSGTLFVNIFGSFLFGIFFVFFQNKTPIINIFLLTGVLGGFTTCLLYTSPSPRDMRRSRMPSSA